MIKNITKYSIFTVVCASIIIFFPTSTNAQAVNLTPANTTVDANTSFSLSMNVESVTELFGVAFDLDFDSSLVNFVNVEEDTFLSNGCQTSLLATETSPGKLIVGITRLGSSCGGITGSGGLMTLNFQSLNQTGTNVFSFSNNSLCILSNGNCNNIVGTWNSANITIGTTLQFTAGDFNQDGAVNTLDWSFMNQKWNTTDSQIDLNNDGIVNSIDFSIMNGNWG